MKEIWLDKTAQARQNGTVTSVKPVRVIKQVFYFFTVSNVLELPLFSFLSLFAWEFVAN